MTQYVLRRLVRALIAVWIAVTITFFLLRLLPADPTTVMLEGGMTPEQQEALIHQYGLDQPLLVQYGTFLIQLLQGNFGVSFRQLLPVSHILLERLPWTLLLAGLAFIGTIIIGIPVGVWAAVHKNSWLDKFLKVFGVAGNALFVPAVGIALLVFFGVFLHWAPIGGAIDPDAVGIDAYVSIAQRVVLPAVSLIIVLLGPYALVVRTNMIEVLGEDYIRSARAHGLGARRIVWNHGLRNAIIPAITLMGLQLGTLFGGAVLTETVFAYPGVGRLIFESVGLLDFPILQGAFIVLAITVVVANLITDIICMFLDPKLRVEN